MEEKKKKLGLFALVALVAGNMIGSGIFLLPSNLAQLGSLSLVSWVITGLGTLCLAFVFARMSSLVLKVGGPYAYAKETFGNFIGFQTAYSYWIAIWVGNAAIALAAVGYLSVFFPALANPFMASLVSIIFIWIFTFINIMGVHNAGIVQSVTMVLKLIPILFIAFVGWFYFDPSFLFKSLNVTTPHQSNFSLITQAATLTLWAFIGVESATVPSDSVKNPKRNIPLATFIGTIIAAVAYICSSTAIMGMLPNSQLQVSNSPFADAAAVILGPWGRGAVALGAIISSLGCLNGWILLQGQIPMAAGKDKLFPKIFQKINKRGVPAIGLVISSLLISIVLLLTISKNLVDQFKVTILVATLANLIPYLYVPVAEIILLRHKENSFDKRAKIIAFLAIIYSFWAITGAGQDILSYGMILIFSTMPLYLLIPVHKSKSAKNV